MVPGVVPDVVPDVAPGVVVAGAVSVAPVVTANVGRDENVHGQPTALPTRELPTRTRTWYAVPTTRFTLAPD